MFSDEHNLVGEKLKNDPQWQLLSTQESNSYSHLVSDPILKIT